MPPIRAMLAIGNQLDFTDMVGIRRLLRSVDIPGTENTVLRVENYVNNTYLPTVVQGAYQMRVHIIALAPLQFQVIAANIGVIIPVNWWLIPVVALP